MMYANRFQGCSFHMSIVHMTKSAENEDETKVRDFPSLMELSSAKVILHPSLITGYLPIQVQDALVAASVKSYNVSSIMFLLELWGCKTFQLKLDNILTPYDVNLLLMKAVKANIHPGKAFCETLTKLVPFAFSISSEIISDLYCSKEPKTKIRYLDISNVLLGSNTMLELCTLLNKNFGSITCRACGKKHLSLDEQLGDQGCSCCDRCDQLTILANLCVNPSTVEGVRKAIVAGQEGSSPVKIVISGLHQEGRFDVLFDMLELADPKSLKIFSWSKNFSPSFHMAKFFKCLKKFNDLTSLDLSSNYGDFVRYVDYVADALAVLNHLVQLRLAKNFILGHLKRVLDGMQAKSLVHLDLAFCMLLDTDYEFLGNCHLMENLKSLNISGNNLKLKWLVRTEANNQGLRVLNLNNCQYEDATPEQVDESLNQMKNIRYLNVDFLPPSCRQRMGRNRPN